MKAALLVLFTLLLISAVGARANYALSKRIADKLELDEVGLCKTVMGKCPLASLCHKSDPPPLVSVSMEATNTESPSQINLASTSGFAAATDFMSHAKEMDARKLRAGTSSSPAKKIEHMMAQTDHEARKLRSILVRGG